MKKLKKVAITGGKGGTGKSTTSILLANKFRANGKKVILVDCDVECPNDYLLLNQSLEKEASQVYANFPKLNKKECIKCGLCSQKCHSNAIFQAPKKFPIFIHELCSGCGLCWNICPQKAIQIEKKLIGKIYMNKINNNFYLITGKSFGIVEETGPIVSKTKEYALKIAKKIKADYLLFDTAVGLHCGVIRALIDSDLSYAVTEPTPLGAHDLKLILSLLKKLNVPKKIIINQANLGKIELIEKIAKEEKTEISYKIDYSEKIVKAYSKGELEKINLLKL
jgi:MinD superfamily P-loop ATPase